MPYITGIIRLTTPLHCAAPNETDGGAGNSTRTMTQAVIADKRRTFIPFFPGNDLRGRLRRKMGKIVMDSLSAKGKFSRELYTAISCGGKDNNPEQDITIEEALRARKNVYMGVAGGGKRLLRSGYRIGDLVPVLATTVASGLVPEAYADLVPVKWGDGASTALEGFELTGTRQMLKVDDAFRVLNPDDLDKYVHNALVEVATYQQDVFAGREARKAKEGDKPKKSDVGNIYTIQAIAPGTSMYFHMEINNALTPAQIGLLLSGLLALVNEQALGGFVRNRFGAFSVDLKFDQDAEQTQIFVPTQHGRYALNTAFTHYIEAMEAEVAALTVDEMMMFFDSKASKEKEVA